MAKDPRGFAGMDQDKRHEIASKGGKAAHAKGTAHEWSREQAREAGRKRGLARRKKSSIGYSCNWNERRCQLRRHRPYTIRPERVEHVFR